MVERVTVKQAAKEIGCAQEYLRRQMKAGVGRWPELGEVIKPPKGGEKYRFFIFRAKLDKFLGKENATCAGPEQASSSAAQDG